MKNVWNHGIPSKQTDKKIDEFKSLLEAFCRMAHSEGVSLSPYDGAGPACFAQLPEANQIKVLENFRFYFTVCAETLAHGNALQEDKVFTWRMFQKMRVHPPADLFKEYEKGQIIEVYDNNFIQIFRNLTFFKVCSYTLDELLCRPFWELVSREDHITKAIVDQASPLLEGTVRGVLHFEIPWHEITEISSPRKNRVLIKQRLGATLWDSQKRPQALIAFLDVGGNKREAR